MFFAVTPVTLAGLPIDLWKCFKHNETSQAILYQVKLSERRKTSVAGLIPMAGSLVELEIPSSGRVERTLKRLSITIGVFQTCRVMLTISQI